MGNVNNIILNNFNNTKNNKYRYQNLMRDVFGKYLTDNRILLGINKYIGDFRSNLPKVTRMNNGPKAQIYFMDFKY
jgi:hypothetical protein